LTKYIRNKETQTYIIIRVKMVKICTSNTHNFVEEECEQFKKFPYELDTFQKYAISGLMNDKNVLITAHTGSGKSNPFEFSVDYFTSKGKKVIYTSPIKSLSNQKFKELTEQFPNIDVGILTGDIKFNPEADCIIMTTEILRNTLMQMQLIEKGLVEKSKTNLHFEMDIQNELACVVFDEVHYINDKDRGKVWEETIMYLPNHVQMLMLSATIDRPEKFARWVEATKGKETWLCPTNHRVVPLYHYAYYAFPKSVVDNIKDSEMKYTMKHLTNTLTPLKEKNESHILKPESEKIFTLDKYTYKNGIKVNMKYVVNQLLDYLKGNNLLPSIIFIFSRKGAYHLLKQIEHTMFSEEEAYKSSIVEKECRKILMKLPNYKEYMMLPEYTTIVSYLRKGIAVHHSGVLPVFREMIEILYKEGFIKVLIATETFAVGINMPTKCTIFTSIQKYDGSGFRYLMSHEYTQMAGRAGRRGLDDKGIVIHLANLFEVPQKHTYESMLNGPPQTLMSKFKVSFPLVLRMVESKHVSLTDILSKTMLSSEKDEHTKYMNKELLHRTENMISMYDDISTYKDFDTVREYCDLHEKLSMMSSKKKKTTQRKLQMLESNVDKRFTYYVQKYSEYLKLRESIKQDEHSLNDVNSYENKRMMIYYDLLHEFGFVEEGPIHKEEIRLTHKGIAASMIQEMNGIIASEMFHTLTLEEYDPKTIISVLSMFVPIRIKEELRCQNCDMDDENILYLSKKVRTIVDKYYDIELRAVQDIDVNDYYYQFDLMRFVYEWIDVTDEHSALAVIQKLDTIQFQVGEFVKAMLKLVNIMEELKHVCQYFGNTPLEHTLNEMIPKILKFVVTNQSLYV
jgi:superfamily II RNA helicase